MNVFVLFFACHFLHTDFLKIPQSENKALGCSPKKSSSTVPPNDKDDNTLSQSHTSYLTSDLPGEGCHLEDEIVLANNKSDNEVKPSIESRNSKAYTMNIENDTAEQKKKKKKKKSKNSSNSSNTSVDSCHVKPVQIPLEVEPESVDVVIIPLEPNPEEVDEVINDNTLISECSLHEAGKQAIVRVGHTVNSGQRTTATPPSLNKAKHRQLLKNVFPTTTTTTTTCAAADLDEEDKSVMEERIVSVGDEPEDLTVVLLWDPDAMTDAWEVDTDEELIEMCTVKVLQG